MRRCLLATGLAGLLAASAAGCGIDTEEAGRPPGGDTGSTTTPGSTTPASTVPKKDLPERPDGVVAIEGPRQGSLTPLAIERVSGARVTFANVGESEGIADLCAGRIDVLDTSRRITPAERRVCARNGVDLAEPIQVASDAVVIATRNESDVGGDCLRLTTVDDIFRAGSPLTRWSEVGFFDQELRVTGREATAAAFQFFAQTVLDVPSNASLADVRSDYLLHTTDDGVRREVTSEARVARVNRRFRARIRDLELRRSIAEQAAVTRAINEARQRVLDEIDRENERRAADGVVLTPTQKLLISRSNLRRIERATRAAQDRALRRFSYPRLAFARARYRNALRRARLSGTIGIFRFSYYELYENLLRPMEIWDPARAAESLEAMNKVRVTGPGAAAEGATTTGPASSTTETTTDAAGTTSTQTTTTPGVESEPTVTEDGDVLVDASVTPWCVFPSQTTITNGSYPLSRPLLLYVGRHNLEREEVKTFLRSFVESAQQLASANRLVPVPDTVRETNLDIIEDGDVDGPETAGADGAGPDGTTTTPPRAPDDVPGVARGPETTPATPATTTTAP